MPQIALVSHQHYYDICVGMVPQLLQPSRHVLVSLVLADIVHEEGADGATVIGGGDGAIALLAGSIPDLGLDSLVVDLDAARGKLHTDGGLAVKIELVARETREQVGFSNTAVTYEYDFEEVLQKTGQYTSVFATYASQPLSKWITRDVPYIVLVVCHVGPQMIWRR